MKIKKRFYRIDPLQQNAPQQLIMTHLIAICFIIMKQWLNSGLVLKNSVFLQSFNMNGNELNQSEITI